MRCVRPAVAREGLRVDLTNYVQTATCSTSTDITDSTVPQYRTGTYYYGSYSIYPGGSLSVLESQIQDQDGHRIVAFSSHDT